MSLKPGWYPQEDGTEKFWDGAAWTDAVRQGPESTPTEPPPPVKTKGMGCGALLAILGGLIVLSIVVNAFSDDDSPADDPEVISYTVESTCQDLVKKQLKNPSTADFTDEVRSVTGASGIVVAENVLGGKVTHTYRCTVDGEIVRLVDLSAR